MKGKFKDTKLFKAVKQYAPEVLATITDVGSIAYPGLSNVSDIIRGTSESVQKKIKDAYQQDIDAFALEVKDSENARNREIQIRKMGDIDFMQYFAGFVGLGTFIFIVYALSFLTIPEGNKELFTHLVGIVEGVVLGIFAYYYGSKMKKNQ